MIHPDKVFLIQILKKELLIQKYYQRFSNFSLKINGTNQRTAKAIQKIF